MIKRKKYPLTATEKKRKEAYRKRRLKAIEREKKRKRIERERAKKAKKPKLLASNLLVKEIYLINRRIEASGDNISDWREEMYCENPGEDREALKQCIIEENQLVEKLSKKMITLLKRVEKVYGKEQRIALESFVDRPHIFTNGVSFGSMTYKQKQKIQII